MPCRRLPTPSRREGNVALPACTRCGKTDPRRMIGLMTLWFGPFVDLPLDPGYFHLCPDCYRDHIQRHLEQVRGRLAELHPLARQLGLNVDRPPASDDRSGDAAADPDTGTPVAAGAG